MIRTTSLGSDPALELPRARVLVLLASHNGMPWICEQIASVLQQEGVDVDMLVSDDGSSDGTSQFLDELATNDMRVRLLPVAPPSGSASANFLRLFREADMRNATHVAFCDQDDLWHADKLFEAVNALNRSGAALYSCACTAFWPDGRTADLVQSKRQTGFDYFFEGAGQGCTFVLAIAHFKRVQDFVRCHVDACRQIHFHDWLVYALTRMWQQDWYYDSIPKLCYRQHGNNEIGARSGVSGRKRRIDLIRSGWYVKQLQSMTSICRLAGVLPSGWDDISRLLGDERKLIRNLYLASWLVMHSRRKFVDRLVLAIAAALAWI